MSKQNNNPIALSATLNLAALQQPTKVKFAHVVTTFFNVSDRSLEYKVRIGGVVIFVIFMTLFIPTALQEGSNFLVPLFIALIGLAIGTIIHFVSEEARGELEIMRAEKFAYNNDFHFKTRETHIWRTGRLLSTGDTRFAEPTISGAHAGTAFWLGNYSFSTGEDKSRKTHRYGVVKIDLTRPIDAKTNALLDSFNDLPQTFNVNKTTQSESNFKEVVDNQLLLYRSKPFTFTKSDMSEVFTLIESLGQK